MTKKFPNLVEVFEKHFKANMINKDVESFKRDYLILYGSVILPAMAEIGILSVNYVNKEKL